MGKILQTLNGKKLPIALAIFIITAATAYGQLKERVATNSEVIADLKDTPEQIARVEEQVNGVKESVDMINKRQMAMESNIIKILSAVK